MANKAFSIKSASVQWAGWATVTYGRVGKLKTRVKVKVRTLDIVPLRGTPPQKRSGTDHTVLPANFTVPAVPR